MKHTVCYLLFISCFLLLLFSCGKKEEPTVIRENGYYREQITELPDGISLNTVSNTVLMEGERLYADAWKDVRDEENDVKKIRISFLTDGSDVREEAVSAVGGSLQSYRLSDYAAAEYSVDIGSDGTVSCQLTVTENEKQLFSIDFPKQFNISVTENDLTAGEIFTPTDAVCAVRDAKEMFLLASDSGVIALDKTGKQIWKSKSRSVLGFISTGNRLLCLIQNNGSQMLVEIGLSDGAFGEEMALPEELSAATDTTPIIVKDDSGTFSFCVVNATGVYGVALTEDTETGALANTVTMLLNFTDSDLFNGGYAWRILSPTHFIRLCYDHTGNNNWYISVLTSDGGERPERETVEMLNLNAHTSENITAAVVGFNRSQEQFRIHFTDYSWMEEDARKLKFDAEIAAGNIPDLVLLRENSNYDDTVITYERAGLFADLSKLLPSYDKLLGCYTGCYRNADGSQYVFPLSSNVSMRFANSDYLSGPSTVEELMKAVDSLSEGIQPFYNGYGGLVNSVLSSIYTDFMDTENAVCSFDSQEFIDILSWLTECQSIPSENLNDDNVLSKNEVQVWFAEGKTLFADINIASVTEYVVAERLLGEKAVPYGYPNADKVLKIGYRIGDYFAVTETSEHKDGAAEFIEYYMENIRNSYADYDVTSYSYSYFTEDDIWEWYERMTPYTIVYSPETRSHRIVENEEAENMNGIKIHLTKEDCQRFIDLNDSIGGYCELSSPVWKIIREEYISKESVDHTAAAKVIQSRASLFLSERYG